MLYAKISGYSDYSKQEFEHILGHFTVAQLNRGEHFDSLKKEKELVAVQLDGLTRSYFITESGEEKTTDFCRGGDVLTYSAGLESAMCRIQALKDTTIASIGGDELDAMVKQDSRLQHILMKMMESCLALKSKREIELLSLDGKSSYLKFLKDFTDIAGEIPQYQIASYLGISPISLSRIKNKLS